MSVGIIEIDRESGLDLVIGNESGEEGPSVSLLLNRGQGSYFPQRRVNLNATRYILHDVATGHFNSDGAGDFAVAVDDLDQSPFRASVLVYRNNGSGNVAAPTLVGLTGFFPRSIVAGDATGDGVLDLVVCHATVAPGNQPLGLVTVLRGTGNGTFQALAPVIVGAAPAHAAIGNVDGDELPDVVVSDPEHRSTPSAASGTVFVLYGTGSATNPLGAPVVLASELGAATSLVADIGNGGLPEVLVTSSRTPSTLRTYAQTAPRTFGDPTSTNVGFLPAGIGGDDFTGDQIGDVVIVTRQGLELFRGTGSGFTLSEIVPIGTAYGSLAVDDLNGDGKPDVATVSATNDRVAVVLNGTDAPPTPGPTATITPSPSRTLTPSRTPTGPTPTLAPTARPPTATRTPRSPTRTRTQTATPTITRTPLGPGDANCDGRIDPNDVNGVITRIFRPGCAAADVDGNGEVTVVDLQLILQMVAGS